MTFVVAAMPEHGTETVPEWNGDPASFEAFATSCRWFEHSLKETDRRLAAPRIWAKLSGAAKSVVRHLEPQDFDTTAGKPSGTAALPMSNFLSL